MTNNTRYNNGKIYKIINNFNDLVYIGSTCLPLRKEGTRIYDKWSSPGQRSMLRRKHGYAMIAIRV